MKIPAIAKSQIIDKNCKPISGFKLSRQIGVAEPAIKTKIAA
jgi:biotin operon repressor